MAPELDPAIVQALSLEHASPRIELHGSSKFSSTFKITAMADGKTMIYFVKTGGNDTEVMFAGEHASLNAISFAVPTLCPKSYAHGALTNTAGYFLATDFINLNSPGGSSNSSSGRSLASKLAALHTTPTPIPAGFSTPQFGFPVPTCCGSTIQTNTYSDSWAEFFATNRLLGILVACEKSNGVDRGLRIAVEKTASTAVPRLLGGENSKDIIPVIVHGDLWSGNHGRGSIGMGGIEELVFDPSACYAHSEYDLGIMRMFGGFGNAFFREYHELKPKDEPVQEYEDRGDLYQLYHYLNHFAIFGGGYRESALGIMRRLEEKYGGASGSNVTKYKNLP